MAELLDSLPIVGAFIRDKRDSEHRRDPFTGDDYRGMAPPISVHVRAPQDATVELLWTETYCDEQSGMWHALAGIARNDYGRQTMDNPDFPIGHNMNGYPIYAKDVPPEKLHLFDRPVSRGGCTALRVCGCHINSAIAKKPYRVREILVPIMMQAAIFLVDVFCGDFNQVSYRPWKGQTPLGQFTPGRSLETMPSRIQRGRPHIP